MTINEIMKKNNITMYRLSKESNVPYTTINDICNGKTEIIKCSTDTVYRIAKVLRVSMEALIEPYIEERIDFELFKSSVCHRLKEQGDVGFIIETLENNYIRKYYKKKWYPECFYTLAMLDYISRENKVSLCTDYDDIRPLKLQSVLYPDSILAVAKVTKNNGVKQQSINDSIPEFIRFNIVECEVRNVI